MNNKGFAVSTVLYTLLVAFLMFLGVALAQFSSSSSTIGKANDDLINGTTFSATQVKIDEGRCEWINNTMVKINSKYGTIYWPKDFPDSGVSITVDGHTIVSGNSSTNGKIKVISSGNKLTFKDGDQSQEVTIANICE